MQKHGERDKERGRYAQILQCCDVSFEKMQISLSFKLVAIVLGNSDG